MTILDDSAELLEDSIQTVSSFCAIFEGIDRDVSAVKKYFSTLASPVGAEKIRRSLKRKCQSSIRSLNDPNHIRKVKKKFENQYDALYDFLPPLYKGALKGKKLKTVTIADLNNLYDNVLKSKNGIKKEVSLPDPDNTRIIYYCEKVRESCESLLKKLRGLLEFIKKYSPNIIDAKTFTLNLPNKIRIPGSAHVLIDTDFAKNLAEVKTKKKQEFLQIRVSGKIVIPKVVLHEMSHRPYGVASPLVPAAIRNYFRNNLHAEIPNVRPTKDEQDEIIQLRRKYTPQGSREEGKFRRSGDMSLLVYAKRRGKNPTIILSNNLSEIQKIGDALNRTSGTNIKVFPFTRVYS